MIELDCHVEKSIIGLSSETKPATVPEGSMFLEVDTGKIYIFYSNTWYATFETEVNEIE